MREDLLVVVLCYAGDAAQVEHQLGSYTHHGAPVLALSPADAPAWIPGIENQCAGLSGWKGRHVAYKLMAHWQIMLEYPKTWFLVHESDSVCLSPELPEEIFERDDVLWSMALGEPNQPGTNYNAPWFGHRNVFERMLRESKAHVEEWHQAWSSVEFTSDGTPGEGMGNSEMISTVLGHSNEPCEFDGLRGHEPCHSKDLQGGRLPRSVWTYQEGDPGLLLRSVQEGAWFVTGLKSPALYSDLVQAYEAANA
mgnify:CR=1 FL=1